MEINMMWFKFLIGTMLLFFAPFILPATVNGRFTVLQNSNNEFIVQLQMNTNFGTDDLGGATIVFKFDTASISFTNNPINNIDYTYHNFNGGNYSPATVTRPMANQIWVNIDLPFINNNNGTVVDANPSWTDVVTIHFDVVDPYGMASLTWLTASPFWGIYDADNSTLWQTGQFENLFGPLPVEMISFTGTLLPNDNVLLEWKTASSLNNAGFEVLKSYPNTVEWEVIGYVDNYGDPNSLVEYSFTDYSVHRFPVIRYRLKSIDNDGSYQYSEVIEVNMFPSSYELSQNYPNPFNPSTKIKFTIPSTGSEHSVPVQLKVYDILGNEVATLVDEQKEPGVYEVEMSTSTEGINLASGIYIYRIKAGDPSTSSGQSFVNTKKMILLR
jgi:hypothetical protein